MRKEQLRSERVAGDNEVAGNLVKKVERKKEKEERQLKINKSKYSNYKNIMTEVLSNIWKKKR